MIHQYWKMVVIGFLMLVHGAIGNAARLIAQGPALRRFQLEMLRRHSRVMLQVLGVELLVEGEENWKPGESYLVVSNHLSYLDILLFAAFQPTVFVSTVEVRETPVLGQLANAAGALFVERRKRDNIRDEIAMIREVLEAGFNIVFFPEGTSTNGSSVLPFKRPLFAPAQEARRSVLPVVVQPLEVNYDDVSPWNRDLICYYGAMEFQPHLLALCGCRQLKLKLKILPPIPITEGMGREEIASRAQAAVTENFKCIN